MICLTDKHDYNLDLVCSFLGIKSYSIEHIKEIESLKPDKILTNSLQVLQLSKKFKVTFYLASPDGSPFREPNQVIKRQLHVRPEVEYLCASTGLARILYANFQIKSKVQYPCVRDGDSSPQRIVCNRRNHLISCLENEIESFHVYTGDKDFATAKLYIHIPEGEELVNMRIAVAASHGVPSVAMDTECVREFSSRGDLLINSDNVKQWVQGVKTAMRDRDINSNLSKEGSKRFSNLDALVEKVKFQAQKRAMKKHPDVRKIIEERAIKITKNKKPLPDVFPSTFNKHVYVKEPYVIPSVTNLNVPDWFRESPGEVDVSIIVPMYRSSQEIAEQINSWNVEQDGIIKEIIYVDDACPQKSSNSVLHAWEKRKPDYVGKIITLNVNSGFPTACNEGAKFARGKYLIFLNADTTVTPGWVSPMYLSMVTDQKIGIIGNLQLKEGDVIDSAGSEWMWDNKTFEHIGRNVYNGQRLSRMMSLKEAPKDVLQPNERDMVTGCCMMMPKKVFQEVGGFDVAYRIGYWEDSDLNMEVKSRGYKVYFQPDSVIYHKSGHSRACLHPFIMDNAKLFYDKWVNNHRIDPLVKNRRPSDKDCVRESWIAQNCTAK